MREGLALWEGRKQDEGDLLRGKMKGHESDGINDNRSME